MFHLKAFSTIFFFQDIDVHATIKYNMQFVDQQIQTFIECSDLLTNVKRLLKLTVLVYRATKLIFETNPVRSKSFVPTSM